MMMLHNPSDVVGVPPPPRSAIHAARSDGRPGTRPAGHMDPVDARSLHVGMRLAYDICDRDGVVLLAAGMRVTARFLSLIRQRSRVSILMEPAQPAAQEPSRTTNLDELEQLLAADLKKRTARPRRCESRRGRFDVDALRNRATEGLDAHAATSERLADACAMLEHGGHVPADALRDSVRGFLNMLAVDADLLPTIVAAQESQDEYLYDHWVNVALLSMSMGLRLGMGQQQIVELGLGALLQDLGMLRVPGDIRRADRRLTPEEWVEIKRHPNYTLEWLQRVSNVPVAAQFIAYQTHERADGSGYPRHRAGMFVHPYARIVAVADAYAAMTRSRPHRPSVKPYEAAKKLLEDTNRNKFDSTVVRAFLDSVSLFPIGSIVGLSDGTPAQVLRSNPGRHTRPVVEVLGADGALTGRVIDLSTERDVKVVRAFPNHGLVARQVITGP